MKKLKRIVAFVAALVISMAAALPASALTPAYTRVAMPDPYSIMPLSLDESSTSRTISSSGSFWFGKEGSAKEVAAFTNVYENFSTYVRFTETQSSDYTTFAYNIPAGTYFDFTSAVSYSTSDYQSVLVAGSVQFYLSFSHANSALSALPDRAQFLINGLPVGDPVSISSNLFSFSSMEIDLSSDVSTIGYRFFYDTAKTGSKDSSPYMSAGTDCFIWVTDDVSVTPLEVDDPYIPILTAILSWVQNIFNSVNPLHSALLRIEEAIGSLGGLPSSLDQLIQINQDIYDGLFNDPDSGSSSDPEDSGGDGGAARLPSEYQEVSYIRSSGTQYFDTGVIASDYPNGINYHFSGKSYGSISGAVNSYLWGSLSNSSRSGNVCLSPFEQAYIYLHAGSGTRFQNSFTVGVDFTVDVFAVSSPVTSCTASLNGSPFSSSQSPGSITMPNSPIYLLWCYGVGSTSKPFVGDTYSFTMDAADGTAIRDFVPCYRKSDSVVGLYDLVEGKFYTNAGTGTFSMGEEVNTGSGSGSGSDSGSSSGTAADQFNQDMQEQIDKADEVKDALDSLNTPAPEEIMPEIKDYVSDEELQNFTGTLTVVFDNSAIVSMMMISLSLALVAYVLFGKR